jgi:antitoxin (DNA-binding transcriptional repressor) of toxin-antitoxin stability system
MTHTVTVEEAPARWKDLVTAVGRGEEWLIVDTAGHAVAKLTQPPAKGSGDAATAHASFVGMMKGQIELLPGWDDPLEEFKQFME